MQLSLDARRGQCGEAFCSVNPAVSERQSGSNGLWRSRCDCEEKKAEMMHTAEGKFGWRGREEERKEEGRGGETSPWMIG